jgi:hypothetical protein
LGYEYLDRRKMLEELGEAGNQWEERGKEYDLHCPTIWERFDWSYMAFKALMQHVYLEWAAKDKIVLMGLGGNFLLKDVPFALHVRITAPREVRTEKVRREEEIDRKTAEWLTDKTDHDDACYVHALYNKHWDDPSAYDVVFDTSTQADADIIRTIQTLITEKERLDTPDARKDLQARALAAQVKAAVFSDSQFFVPTLEVFPENGGLVVRGVVHGEDEKGRLEAAVRAMAMGVSVDFQLHFRM